MQEGELDDSRIHYVFTKDENVNGSGTRKETSGMPMSNTSNLPSFTIFW